MKVTQKKKFWDSPAKKWSLVLAVLAVAFVAYSLSGDSLFVNWGQAVPVINLIPEGVDDPLENLVPALENEDIGTEEDNELRPSGFYSNYRLERERVRSQEMEILTEMIADPASSEEIRTDAQRQKLAVASAIEEELLLEAMLMAKNFQDVAVFVQPGQVTVVVSGAVDGQEATKISDMAARTTGVDHENIIIIPRLD